MPKKSIRQHAIYNRKETIDDLTNYDELCDLLHLSFLNRSHNSIIYQCIVYTPSFYVYRYNNVNNLGCIYKTYETLSDMCENKANNYASAEGHEFMNEHFLLNNAIVKNTGNTLLNYCINKAKTSFGIKVRFDLDNTNYKKFLCWLKKYDKLFAKHVIRIAYKPYYLLKDADLFIKVGDHTFARILTGNAIKNFLNDTERREQYDSIGQTTVSMYIFGKESKKIAYKLDKMFKRDDVLVNYTVVPNKNGEGANVYRDISSGRSKDSVFLNDNIKEVILDHVNKFFVNKSIYKQRNLTYKTGILLEGEPGTGKSTIANMIATETNCNLVIIKMNQFSLLDTDFITTTLNNDDETYIVLLEDIDCVIGNRESENDDLENKKNVNKLLQFLDSASSPSNVIFVATTNHIDKLDSAILRDGRFDLKVNITNINEKAATQMCKSFGIKNEETIKRLFNENSVDGRINPAKLQNLILKEIE